MLVIRKISTEKLVIYIAVIILMIGGSVFMLYKNRIIFSSRPAVVNNTEQINKSLVPGSSSLGDETAQNQLSPDQAQADKNLNPSAQSGQPSDASKTKDNGEIDLTIFGKDKFKALKENILTPQDNVNTGKRDPFQPN